MRTLVRVGNSKHPGSKPPQSGGMRIFMKKRYANVGGQAVIEGIMMKSPKKTVLAVRTPDGQIVTEPIKDQSLRKKYKFFNLPLIRGCVAFVESLITGYKTISRSASLAGLEEETKGNKALEGLLMVISSLLGVCLAVGLFIILPVLAVRGLSLLFDPGAFKTLIEGIVKVILFLIYLLLVSKMKDIKRIFEYHGAEHKTIFCFEAGEELTVENVRKQSRLHPRCGTSFLFLVLIIGILVGSFITWSNAGIRILLKLLLMPLTAGISFELIQLAGKYDNPATRIISAPGKALQKITTSEPDDEQIEVAITALKESLTDEDGNLNQEEAYAG